MSIDKIERAIMLVMLLSFIVKIERLKIAIIYLFILQYLSFKYLHQNIFMRMTQMHFREKENFQFIIIETLYH